LVWEGGWVALFALRQVLLQPGGGEGGGLFWDEGGLRVGAGWHFCLKRREVWGGRKVFRLIEWHSLHSGTDRAWKGKSIEGCSRWFAGMGGWHILCRVLLQPLVGGVLVCGRGVVCRELGGVLV
jgi:hypothetical protein